MRPGLYLLSFGGAVAVLVWVDQSPSEIANQASVLVLLLGAGLLGLIKPDWAWLSGVGLGSSLAAAHALYLVTGHPLPYAMSPSGWAGPITPLALLVPAVICAYAGARRWPADSAQDSTPLRSFVLRLTGRCVEVGSE